MKQVLPCRVQWVTQRGDLSRLVDLLAASGAILVSRSAFELETRDLDELEDAETGFLSIAELSMDADQLASHLSAAAATLPAGETMIIDLTGPRLRVSLFPVGGASGVVIRDTGDVRRIPRPAAGFGRSTARKLITRFVPTFTERSKAAGQSLSRGAAA